MYTPDRYLSVGWLNSDYCIICVCLLWFSRFIYILFNDRQDIFLNNWTQTPQWLTEEVEENVLLNDTLNTFMVMRLRTIYLIREETCCCQFVARKDILFNILNTFYLWLYGVMWLVEEGNVLFNNALSTFYLVIWRWVHVKGSFRLRGIPLPPLHELLFMNHLVSTPKSNPIDDHSNISSKTLQKQNFKPLGHYTCMKCTSHLRPRKHTVTYHFSDSVSLQWQPSDSHKMSVAIFTPTLYINKWQMSLCNNSSDNKSYWIHRVDVKVSAQVTTVTHMHQSQPSSHSLRINFTVHLKLWPSNRLIWCNATFMHPLVNSCGAVVAMRRFSELISTYTISVGHLFYWALFTSVCVRARVYKQFLNS